MIFLGDANYNEWEDVMEEEIDRILCGMEDYMNRNDIDYDARETDQKAYDEMVSKGLESAYATSGYTENW